MRKNRVNDCLCELASSQVGTQVVPSLTTVFAGEIPGFSSTGCVARTFRLHGFFLATGVAIIAYISL